MPSLKMTDLAVQETRVARGERADYFDSHPRYRQRGLALRVSHKGPELVKSWCVLYRLKGDPKLRRHTIGTYPDLSLADARSKTGKIVQAAREGVDLPTQWEAERLARQAAEHAEASKKGNTVATVVRQFLAEWRVKPKRRGGRRSESHLAKLERDFANHVLPAWCNRPISDIRRSEVDALISAVALGKDGKGGPVAANHCLRALKAFGNWAVDREIIEANPAHRVLMPGVEVSRERVLSTEEIATVWPAFITLGYPFSQVFRLLLLTGQRLSEVAGMRWSEVDLAAEQPLWTLPSSRAKARRAHVVPLSTQALAIIEELKAYRRAGVDLLFTTTGRTPVSGFSRAKTKTDAAIQAARAERKLDSIAPWRLHDLRRTCTTELGRVGTPRLIVSRVLNHADGSITDVYDRYSYLAEKAAALGQWAAYVERVVSSPKTDKVASLTTERRRRSVRIGIA